MSEPKKTDLRDIKHGIARTVLRCVGVVFGCLGGYISMKAYEGLTLKAALMRADQVEAQKELVSFLKIAHEFNDAALTNNAAPFELIDTSKYPSVMTYIFDSIQTDGMLPFLAGVAAFSLCITSVNWTLNHSKHQPTPQGS